MRELGLLTGSVILLLGMFDGTTGDMHWAVGMILVWTYIFTEDYQKQ